MFKQMISAVAVTLYLTSFSVAAEEVADNHEPVRSQIEESYANGNCASFEDDEKYNDCQNWITEEGLLSFDTYMRTENPTIKKLNGEPFFYGESYDIQAKSAYLYVYFQDTNKTYRCQTWVLGKCEPVPPI